MQFGANDIDEAKRRVIEMQERAAHFVDNTKGKEKNDTNNNTENKGSINLKSNKSNVKARSDDRAALVSDEQKSLFIILALIILLSDEKADNTLIFALLYLLL